MHRLPAPFVAWHAEPYALPRRSGLAETTFPTTGPLSLVMLGDLAVRLRWQLGE